MEFYDLHDFHYSYIELYDFQEFLDSLMEFYNSHDFHTSRIEL